MRPVKLHAEEPLTTTGMANAINDVCKKGELAVVLFTGDWCGPCKTLKGYIFNDKTHNGLSKIFDKSVIFFYIDHDENKELGSTYRVDSLPTILIGEVDNTGSFKVIEKIVGGSHIILENKIKKILNSS